MTTQIFSSYNYYMNKQFVKLMRNWNSYLQYKETEDEDIMNEVEQIIRNDFYRDAKEWLYSVDNKNKKNCNSLIWRKGLE